ncbi:MAG TPA: PqiC family protein [Deltaproteobacteria bacterium]|jgi:hypothetical protein|nr:PqiC family protein [Deltaproteobacteria bacterium]HQJ09126.1 PqiC family protein [Deltaproteobacteria bacterium]
MGEGCRRLFIAACLLSITMSGCAASQPTRFYVLSAAERPAGAGKGPCTEAGSAAIGISPIGLPKYLDRPQIMTRKSENELHLSELNEWAEPLEDGIAAVIAQDLRSLLCAWVETFPWRQSEKIGYRLTVTVVRLDGVPGKQADLHALWSITDEQAKKKIFTKETRYAEPVSSNTEEALVSAYSRLLASLSREIADVFTSKGLVQVR